MKKVRSEFFHTLTSVYSTTRLIACGALRCTLVVFFFTYARGVHDLESGMVRES